MAYDASRALTNQFAVTPSDSANINIFGFYVGATGDVTVMPAAQMSAPDGKQIPVTFKACPAGFVVRDLAIARIMQTGTTASEIVGFGPR